MTVDLWEPSTSVPRWSIDRSFLSQEECLELRTEFANLPKRPNDGSYPVSGVWQRFDDFAEGLFERGMRVNNDTFGLDLTGMFGLQIGRYNAGHSLSQHYDDTTFHSSPGTNSINLSPLSFRKFTVLCMLSKRSEYEGGQLQFDTGSCIENINLEQGDAVLFPTWNLHGVTEVTKGERWIMVAWFTGRRWT